MKKRIIGIFVSLLFIFGISSVAYAFEQNEYNDCKIRMIVMEKMQIALHDDLILDSELQVGIDDYGIVIWRYLSREFTCERIPRITIIIDDAEFLPDARVYEDGISIPFNVPGRYHTFHTRFYGSHGGWQWLLELWVLAQGNWYHGIIPLRSYSYGGGGAWDLVYRGFLFRI